MNESVPISALQHYVFCPRQCALIHVERAWRDNFFTAKGNQLHERVHGNATETRGNVRTERGVQVCSDKYGIHGVLDLLEINKATGLVPVEYKKGKPKVSDCDRVQLCAQALCLEEMTGSDIPKAALWYWQPRKREWIELDTALREFTLEVIKHTRDMLSGGHLPKAEYKPACKSCSLIDICEPKACDKSRQYMNGIFDL